MNDQAQNTERNPRPATEQELELLRRHYMEIFGYDYEESDMLLNAEIAVHDHYSTGGPGYQGKVATIVWDGAPEYVSSVWFNKDGSVCDSANHSDYCNEFYPKQFRRLEQDEIEVLKSALRSQIIVYKELAKTFDEYEQENEHSFLNVKGAKIVADRQRELLRTAQRIVGTLASHYIEK